MLCPRISMTSHFSPMVSAVTASEIKSNTENVTPTLLRAPELLLGHPWSTAVDIWAVGCMVGCPWSPRSARIVNSDHRIQTFEFLTGVSLFQLNRAPGVDRTSIHLGRIEEHLGSFPRDFLQRCNNRSEFIGDSGTSIPICYSTWAGPTYDRNCRTFPAPSSPTCRLA